MKSIFRTALAAAALLLCAYSPASAATPGVTANVQLRVDGQYAGSNSLGSALYTFDQNNITGLTAGTGTAQADLMYSASRTLAASGTETLDLSGVLTDAFGQTLSFAHIKAIYISAVAANTNDVVIGAAGSSPFLGPLGGTAPTISVRPGGAFLITNPLGWAVTNASNDQLKVTNSAGTTGVTYNIIVIGTST